MTGLLASVTGFEEAQIALTAGADIIDLKQPSRGALGALPLSTIRAVVRAVNGRRPVSATVGDLPPESEVLTTAVEATLAAGVDYVKVGFFEPARSADYIRILAPYALNDRCLIAVLFADQKPDSKVLVSLSEAGFTGVMLDTANKSGGGLRRHMNSDQLFTFVNMSRGRNLLCGLAGSLRLDDVAPLLDFNPDYLGFRTALCSQGQREGVIDPQAVSAIRARIPRLERRIRVPA